MVSSLFPLSRILAYGVAPPRRPPPAGEKAALSLDILPGKTARARCVRSSRHSPHTHAFLPDQTKEVDAPWSGGNLGENYTPNQHKPLGKATAARARASSLSETSPLAEAKKIIFINPPYERIAPGYEFVRHITNKSPSLGLLHLAAEVRLFGYRPSIIESDIFNLSVEAVAERVIAERPAYVGITLFTVGVWNAVAIARRIKQALPRTVVIVGGPHISSMGHETMARFHEFDYAVVCRARSPWWSFSTRSTTAAISGPCPALSTATATPPARPPGIRSIKC